MRYVYNNIAYTVDAELYVRTDDINDLYLINDEADEYLCVADLPEDIQLDIIETVYPEEVYFQDEVEDGTF
jgi:hypothetical protein